MDYNSFIKRIIKHSPIWQLLNAKNLNALNHKGLLYNYIHGYNIDDDDPGSNWSIKSQAKLIKNVEVAIVKEFIYPFDTLKKRCVSGSNNLAMSSVTPDYSVILKSDLSGIVHSLQNNVRDKKFCEAELKIANAISTLSRKINAKYPDNLYAQKLPELLNGDAQTFEDAIQKILFYHGLLYQVGHWHNGLGRLDYILYPYFKKDFDNKIITLSKAKELLEYMCETLNTHMYQKSGMLKGDTGQYILLGGIDENGNTIENELTHLFLEVFTEIKMPDPKLILRVNKNTSNDVWDKAIRCISNGCGSPLIMNETLIMKKMVDFGYELKDVWNVGTSACWEPLIIGKSSDQNNPFKSIVACDALEKALEDDNYDTFDSLLNSVKINLAIISKRVVKSWNYDYSPILSLFNDDCLSRNKDFTHGGTKYMYQGAQVLSFPNLINSLLNINKFVFEEQIITLDDCKEAISSNYKTMPELKNLFSKPSDYKFGSTNEKVLGLCNDLIETISEAISQTSANGNAVKFGLSSPNYIVQSKETKATLDGRMANEPYAVHISPISSNIDISEVLSFASNIKYPTNCINGNVVDFILPCAYINNPIKMRSVIKDAINNGLYELQLNVLDKAKLVDAKTHPEKYPDLIVRVWGFSAYFNDLPEEYKDNLIARADTYNAN